MCFARPIPRACEGHAGERAQAIAAAFDERQLETQEALKRYEALVQETVDAGEKRDTLGLDANAFAIYTTVGAIHPCGTAEQAQEVNALFARYPDYRWDGQQESSLRSELYRVLLPLVGPGQMVAAANALMRLERV